MVRPAILIAAVFAMGITPPGEPVEVVIETSEGDIVVELFPDSAPNTVQNFLRYVDAGLYAGGEFFRTVHSNNQPNDSIRIAVIQGGMNPDRVSDAFGPIELERTSNTGLRHVNGTISMARAGPDTATHSFFICIGDQPSLDYGGMRNPDGQGFAAFGRLVEGMDVVLRINASPAQGQSLQPPISISRIARR